MNITIFLIIVLACVSVMCWIDVFIFGKDLVSKSRWYIGGVIIFFQIAFNMLIILGFIFNKINIIN